MIDIFWICTSAFVAFGAGVAVTQYAFERKLNFAADEGRKIDLGGKVFAIYEVSEYELTTIKLDQLVSGAVFDFAGFMTTNKESIAVGATENASPVAELITSWAKQRNLPLDGAKVETWSLYLDELRSKPCQ